VTSDKLEDLVHTEHPGIFTVDLGEADL